MYRTCVQVQQRFRSHLQCVTGSVVDFHQGADCVACPVLSNLFDAGLGAQGAIRDTAGEELERFIEDLRRERGAELETLEVVIAPGGNLASAVALVVTEPDFSYHISAFLRKMHRRLIAAVRAAGHRVLAMPTLGTGGMGFHPAMVCQAVARAVAEDFVAHLDDPVLVRVCCFERAHARCMQVAKRDALQYLFHDAIAVPCPVSYDCYSAFVEHT